MPTTYWAPNQAAVAQVETVWALIPLNQEYMVSSIGTVFDRVKQVIIEPRPNGNCLQMFLRNPRRIVTPGRLVLEAFVGPCPSGMECCHYDDNQRNNVLSNLRWGTKSDNAMDRVRNGLRYDTCGEQNGMSELTANNVLEARSLRNQNSRYWTWKRLGNRYNVCRHTARLAVLGKTWAHLETK